MIGLFDGQLVPIQDEHAYRYGDFDGALPSRETVFDIIGTDSDGSEWPIYDRVPQTMALNFMREFQPSRADHWPKFILRASR